MTNPKNVEFIQTKYIKYAKSFYTLKAYYERMVIKNSLLVKGKTKKRTNDHNY